MLSRGASSLYATVAALLLISGLIPKTTAAPSQNATITAAPPTNTTSAATPANTTTSAATPVNTTTTAAPPANTTNTTGAPPSTLMPTTTLVPPPPATTTPTPTLHGELVGNPTMAFYVTMITTQSPATFNPTAYTATLRAAVRNASVAPLLLLLGYCGANTTEPFATWTSGTVCYGRIDSQYTNILVQFGYEGATSVAFYSTATINISLVGVALAPSTGALLFNVQPFSSFQASSSGSSSGIVDRVESTATNNATAIVIILIVLILACCGTYLGVRVWRSRKRAQRSAAADLVVPGALQPSVVDRSTDRLATANAIPLRNVYETQVHEELVDPPMSSREQDKRENPAAATSLFTSRPAWGSQPSTAAPAVQPPTAEKNGVASSPLYRDPAIDVNESAAIVADDDDDDRK